MVLNWSFFFHCFFSMNRQASLVHNIFATRYLPSEVLYWLKFQRFDNSLDRKHFSTKATFQHGSNSSLLFWDTHANLHFWRSPDTIPLYKKKLLSSFLWDCFRFCIDDTDVLPVQDCSLSGAQHNQKRKGGRRRAQEGFSCWFLHPEGHVKLLNLTFSQG